jgi:membrane protein DedA with SNARE-associated domain
VISNWIYTITVWFGTLGYWGVFIACLGLFPAEIVIAMVGAQMPDKLIQIATVAALGEVGGAIPTYLIGRFFSRKDLLKFINGKGKFLHISEDSYNSGHKAIRKKGSEYLFISRFIPWVRVVSGLVAGYVKYNIFLFCLIVFAGTFIYSYAFAYLGSKIGFTWEKIENILNTYNNSMLILTVIVIAIYIWVSKRKKKD